MPLLAATPAVADSKRLTLAMLCALMLHGMFIVGVSRQKWKPAIPPAALPTVELTLEAPRIGLPVSVPYGASPHAAPLTAPHAALPPEPPQPPPPPLTAPPPPAIPQAPAIEPFAPPPAPPIDTMPVQSVPAVDAMQSVASGHNAALHETKRIRHHHHDSETQRQIAPEPSFSLPSGAALVARGLAFADSGALLNVASPRPASHARHKIISANSGDYSDAAYLDAWSRKVETIGNLNYPDAARQDHLTGTLALYVALNPDGSLNSVKIWRSSGHDILDQAAINIVKLAAPYAPIPSAIRKRGGDVFDFIRPWRFTREERVSSR